MNDLELQQLVEQCRMDETAWQRLYGILRDSPVCLSFRARYRDGWEDAIQGVSLKLYEELSSRRFEWQGLAAFWEYVKLQMMGQVSRREVQRQELEAPLDDRLPNLSESASKEAVVALILCQMRLLAKIQTVFGDLQRAILEADFLVWTSNASGQLHKRCSLAANKAGQATEQAVNNRHKGKTRLKQLFQCESAQPDVEVCKMIKRIWG